MITRTAITVAAVFATLGGAALEAQVSPHSQPGVTGPVITTSDVAGGAFSPDADVAVASPAVRVAVLRAASRISLRLSAGTATDPTGRPLPAAAQPEILRALQGDSIALERVVGAIHVPGASALRASLDLLLVDPQPGQVVRAVAEFNRVVDAASAEILADPPEEFRVVHALLHALASAAIAASR